MTALLPQQPRWAMALLGLFIFIFSAVALSGPGRIDIDDGQARFEVAQSLVDHGDVIIRDPNIVYTVFPGRNGQRFTEYRLPQSLLGAAAIWSADHTGAPSEGRRHFFFTLTSAFSCAVLAVTYAGWFRFLGQTPRAALGWACAGVFCTPSWYYGTSTFDDILGSAALVLAVGVAHVTRRQRSIAGAAGAGLLLGLAINCKQPLGLFLPAVLIAHHDRQISLRLQLGRLALILGGVALGIAAYKGYDFWKFPPGSIGAHSELLKKNDPTWSNAPLAGLLGLVLSPGAGAVWYCPTLILCFRGLAGWYRSEKGLTLAIAGGSLLFLLFVSLLVFFKGDMTWGPRYLTPIFALFWIFAPAGAALMRRGFTAMILVAGLLVQLLALSVDPHRLYLERNLWSRFYAEYPWLYFDPAVAHLVNRPREIVEILTDHDPPAEAFSPGRSPTYALPILEATRPPRDYPALVAGAVGEGASSAEAGPLPVINVLVSGQVRRGPQAIREYQVFRSFRPWWASQKYLPPEKRPVDLKDTVLLLSGGLIAGLVLMLAGSRVSGRSRAGPASAGSAGC